MKAVVIGESSGATMEVIMSVYPRHKLVADKYIERGDVIGIGPFSDRGNMAIFKTRCSCRRVGKRRSIYSRRSGKIICNQRLER